MHRSLKLGAFFRLGSGVYEAAYSLQHAARDKIAVIVGLYR